MIRKGAAMLVAAFTCLLISIPARMGLQETSLEGAAGWAYVLLMLISLVGFVLVPAGLVFITVGLWRGPKQAT